MTTDHTNSIFKDRMVVHISHALVADLKKASGYSTDEDRDDTDSDTEQLSWNNFKSTLKVETFNGGLT